MGDCGSSQGKAWEWGACVRWQCKQNSRLPGPPHLSLSFPAHIISIILGQEWAWGRGADLAPPLAGSGKIHHTPNIYFKITYTQNTPRSHFCVSDLIICSSLSLSFLIKNCYKSFCHRRYKTQVCWRNCLADLFCRWFGALLCFFFFFF